MKIESGRFYFIRQEVFVLFSKYNLMHHKENGNKIPCYFCFRDESNYEIIWFVPISSRVEKYREIYDLKKLKNKRAYNFVFGKLLGKETVFLIQNMFPTTEKYIEEKYVNKNGDVKISNKLQKEVLSKANSVIALAKQGIRVSFYDIEEMKRNLLNYT